MTPRQVKKLRKVISAPCYYKERAIALAEELADLRVEKQIFINKRYGEKALAIEFRRSRLCKKLEWYLERI